ncbi:hypothetical protein AB6A40_000511 [Gnathostoma spinigerum]|uniref:Protein NDNF n=1 Tax=Gnathostoma spinigerum TaxID=75299 RepID=A0ABD6EAU3_9BILA
MTQVSLSPEYLLILLFLQSICSSLSSLSPTLLNDGQEYIVHLAPNVPQRLFYKTVNRGYPLWMFVTPCGSNVHWQLFKRQLTSEEVNVHPSSDRFNRVMHDRIPPLTDMHRIENAFKLLAGEAGGRRMAFYSQHLDSDDIMIVLTSDSYGSARIFVTTLESRLIEQYPPLPTDKSVHYEILNVHTTDNINTSIDDLPKLPSVYEGVSVKIRWRIPHEIRMLSKSNEVQLWNRYRFCTVISRKQSDWTVCDELSESLESIHCVNQTVDHLIIDKLLAGHHYYVTVFFRDGVSGGTSTLRPLEIHIPEMNEIDESYAVLQERAIDKDDKKVHPLADAQMITGRLASSKNAAQSYKFVIRNPGATRKKVLLVVHGCDGYIRVAIYRNGHHLKNSDPFSGFRRFLVTSTQSAILHIRLINDDSKPKVFRLWASITPEKSPYPKLPDDTSMKETRRSCSSVTLQWLRAADAFVRYCLYRRKETVQFLEELVSKHINLCDGQMPSEDLVGCYDNKRSETIKYYGMENFEKRMNNTNGSAYSSEFDKSDTAMKGAGCISDEVDETINVANSMNGIIETTVHGLQSDTTYRFDLLARPLHKAHTNELPYRTIWVKTRAFC